MSGLGRGQKYFGLMKCRGILLSQSEKLITSKKGSGTNKTSKNMPEIPIRWFSKETELFSQFFKVMGLNVIWIRHVFGCLMKIIWDNEYILAWKITDFEVFWLSWAFKTLLLVLTCSLKSSDWFHNIPWYVKSPEHPECITQPYHLLVIFAFDSNDGCYAMLIVSVVTF